MKCEIVMQQPLIPLRDIVTCDYCQHVVDETIQVFSFFDDKINKKGKHVHHNTLRKLNICRNCEMNELNNVSPQESQEIFHEWLSTSMFIPISLAYFYIKQTTNKLTRFD